MTWERVYAEVCERKYGGNTHQPRVSQRGEKNEREGGRGEGVERRTGGETGRLSTYFEPDNYFSNLLLRPGKLNYAARRAYCYWKPS